MESYLFSLLAERSWYCPAIQLQLIVLHLLIRRGETQVPHRLYQILPPFLNKGVPKLRRQATESAGGTIMWLQAETEDVSQHHCLLQWFLIALIISSLWLIHATLTLEDTSSSTVFSKSESDFFPETSSTYTYYGVNIWNLISTIHTLLKQ